MSRCVVVGAALGAALAAAVPAAPAGAPPASAPAATRPAAATPPAATPAEARALLDSLYGAEIRKVAATATFSDDAELAGKILQGARRAAGRPEVLDALCSKVYELGSKTPAGYAAAIEAMDLLGRARPEKEKDCWARTLALLQRKYARSTKFTRLEAAEYLLAMLTNRAERMRLAGDFDEALLMLRKAGPVAANIRWPLRRNLLDMQRYLVGRNRIAIQVRSAEALLKSRPADRATRLKLIRFYLLELDRPAQAAALVSPDVGEAMRTYLPLAARPVEQVDPNVSFELGNWYRAEADKASPDGKVAAFSRAAAHYRRFLKHHAEGDVKHLQAKLALENLLPPLRAAATRYPLKKVTSPLRADLLAHGRARNRLPVKLQIQLLNRRLKETHGGKEVRVHFPTGSTNEIRSADVRDRGLTCLEALAALPLRSLSLAGCTRLKGDLAALAGMPLTRLDLSDCSALESLHGLAGVELKSLDIRGCLSLTDLGPLMDLPIEALAVGDVPPLRDANQLTGLPLKSLSLVGFATLRDLTALKDTQIVSLYIEKCPIETFQGAEGLQLRRLQLVDCTHVRSLAALKGQVGIGGLNLTDCARLESLDGLQGMPLKGLTLAGCAGLTGDLAAVKDARLTSLDLTGCAGLTSLKGLEYQPLATLTLAGCKGLTGDLTALANAVVVTLDLTGCRGLTSLKGIESLPVKTLSLSGCGGLVDDLPALKGLGVASLDLSNQPGLTSLGDLPALPLTSLALRNCKALTDLTGLKAPKLTSLDLAGCTSLTSLKGIASLRLRDLDLTGCGKLTDADYEMLVGMKSLYRFRPAARGKGGNVLKAIHDRRNKPRRRR